jgi:hypothetical protein
VTCPSIARHSYSDFVNLARSIPVQAQSSDGPRRGKVCNFVAGDVLVDNETPIKTM